MMVLEYVDKVVVQSKWNGLSTFLKWTLAILILWYKDAIDTLFFQFSYLVLLIVVLYSSDYLKIKGFKSMLQISIVNGNYFVKEGDDLGERVPLSEVSEIEILESDKQANNIVIRDRKGDPLRTYSVPKSAKTVVNNI